MSNEHDEQPQSSEDGVPESGISPAADSGQRRSGDFRWAPGIDALKLVRVAVSHQQMLQKLGEQVTEQVASLTEAGRQASATAATLALAHRNIGAQIRQVARAAVPVTARYEFASNLGRVLEANQKTWFANIRTLVEQALELIPTNLRGLTSDELRDVMRINEEDGTSLAWAPRQDIVDELIAAPDMDARSTLLVARVAEIADDVDASLATVTLAEHQRLRSILAESVCALRAGLYGPAQAAASTALDTLLYVHVLDYLQHDPQSGKAETRKHFKPIEVDGWEDATLSEVELVLVGAGILTAFKSWKRGKGPLSFNRNGSIHQVDDGAYSPAHAIRAVLIAQACLRWLDTAAADAQDDEDVA
ncbi:hypothetical protein ACH41H_36415 [Streptomyces sp. NPDC020800]|uniref:hypothetical protein n=1 Tax=Streptomyces sp. NPDC020800 TaxID=3365092 RepID=UPI0037A5EEBA